MPRNKTHKLFYRRAFLNRPRYHAGAHVIAVVNVDIGESTKGKRWALIDSDIEMSDCSRVIHLTFDASKRRDAANALHKVRMLADTFTRMAEAYELAIQKAFDENENA